jgi:23S rRNA (uracil1939-C5)-methyltransferase
MPKVATVEKVRIDSLAYGGQGVGRLENGKVAFIRGALPSELVLAKIYRKKRSYVEGRTLEILEASAERMVPRCPHFGPCGGCTWQNMSYQSQLQTKEQQVKEILCHPQELGNPPISPIVGMDQPWYYRNQSELTFGLWDGQVILGQHLPGSFSLIEDLSHCYILSANSSEIFDAVRDFSNERRLLPYNRKAHQGLLRNLAVRIGKNTGELMANLVTSPGEFPQFAFARYLKERISPTSIVWTTTTSLSDRYSPEKESVLWGSNYLYEILGKLKFEISAHSFFQTNSSMAERMCQVIEEMTEATGDETVLDVYSGIGTIGLFIAGSVKQVYGIESSPSAVEDAKINARLNKVDNAKFVCAKAEDYLDSFSGKELQIAVLDPPRAGVHPKVIASLLKIKPERIIYVSCNPTTLVRDLVLLAEGYRIEAVQPIDMFPQTYHIEAVVKLKRKPA